ncbi:unnamed protein product, partial [Staurois parvus]
ITSYHSHYACRLRERAAQRLPVPITAITDHQGTDDQCALMISVAPEVPPVSAHQCQCPSVPHASAHQCHINATYQCIPVHINANISAHLSCLSMSPISASQCLLSVPMPVPVYQCCQSVRISV